MDKQITIVVAVIQNERGEILLAKRHQPDIPEIHGKWEFVGGGIDFGEDPIDALKREVKEEIGVDIHEIKLLPKIISDIQEFQDGKRLQVITLSYSCKILSGQPQANLDQEIAELKFVSLEEIKNYQAFNNIYQAVELLKTNF